MLRLRDGETGLIGGLLQGTEASSFAGAIGMNDIPIIGKLFGNRKKSKDESEVLISITPRIVRGPKVTEEDLVPLRVGTEEVRRVEGARPGLFGPEPPAAAAGARTAAPPAGAPARGPQAQPPAPAPALAAPGLPPPSGITPQANPSSVPAGAPPVVPPVPAEAPTGPPSGPPAGSPGAELGSTSAILSPPEVALREGQSAGVAVLLVGARDVLSVELTLVFDPALVQVGDVTPGALLTLDGASVQTERQLESGRVRVRFARTTGASGSGAVATVTLQGIKAGSGALAVESIVVGHAAGAERPAPPAPGRVVVAP